VGNPILLQTSAVDNEKATCHSRQYHPKVTNNKSRSLKREDVLI